MVLHFQHIVLVHNPHARLSTLMVAAGPYGQLQCYQEEVPLEQLSVGSRIPQIKALVGPLDMARGTVTMYSIC